MPFKLACGDVMPGCSARFENDTRQALLAEVAGHASADHDLHEITPDVLAQVESRIVAC
ncbi:DUF1059 domain-containing protein [Nocardioides acrostichi]|uniref:DUF1059 domain-containing protein n=1 Tax=Nocardioides acrostichi TaxID=2784339 RepID=A0A930Y916_9ACTN|nr:DUF1059 domain-containing protein [Nocardioides acrostichi]MBF4163656.1 DUF1059 domain-containing protein [Nocardioides acrostichi]